MALDPEAKSYLESLAMAGGDPLNTLEPEVARKGAKADFSATAGSLKPVKRIIDKEIAVENGKITIRIIDPGGDGPLPVVLYYHGGGWVLGDLDDFEGLMRSLAIASGTIVVGVDYRLAPEYKFPTAVHDSYAALHWVSENIASFGGDPNRIAVAGDSAGGNLSTVITLLSRDKGGPRIVYQVLIYPATDLRIQTQSFEDLKEGFFLGKEDMIWFRSQYLRTEEDITNPLASPLLEKNLHGLPPALVITAEYDPLKDEGKAYADRLKAADVPVDHMEVKGMIHTFLAKPKRFPQADETLTFIGEKLRAIFST